MTGLVVLAAIAVKMLKNHGKCQGTPPGAQKGPIKIGVIRPDDRGGAAQVGKDMVNGMTHMRLAENGNKIAGRPVEVIVEDSQGQPHRADQAAQAGGEATRC